MRPLALLALLAGCTSRLSVGLPGDIKEQEAIVGLGLQGKVDLLFMIDNSPGMAAMQQSFVSELGTLVQRLETLNQGARLDLHLGVVTSDYGAGDLAGGNCDASPGGQRGLLQTVGVAAAASCRAPLGSAFVDYVVDGDGSISSNLPAGQDLTTTLGCMAAVGTNGCGFEHQLESVRAALQNQVENVGFVRDDASLAVVFLSNEDDGSAPPTAKLYEAHADEAMFGPYDTYRQTRFAIQCGSMLAPQAPSNGPMSDCLPAPDDVALVYGVDRYQDFFTRPLPEGGLKSDPSRVALFGILAPVTTFATVLAQEGSGQGVAPDPSYLPCAAAADGSCVVRLQHSCQNHVNPSFFGDPAVRLNAVLNQVATHAVWSICGDDDNQWPDFTNAMVGIADGVARQAAGGCLPAPLVHPASPSCNVGSDVASLPECNSVDHDDCWHVVVDPLCPPRTDPNDGEEATYRLVVENINPSQAVGLRASCLSYNQTR